MVLHSEGSLFDRFFVLVSRQVFVHRGVAPRADGSGGGDDAVAVHGDGERQVLAGAEVEEVAGVLAAGVGGAAGVASGVIGG